MTSDLRNETATVRIGHALRAARLDARLSIDDVARHTRIRASMIEAIESGADVDMLAPVYLRGHVRAMAGPLGVDSQHLLDIMESETDGADRTRSR